MRTVEHVAVIKIISYLQLIQNAINTGFDFCDT